MQAHRGLITFLVYSGALPFMLIAVLAWYIPAWLQLPFAPVQAGLSYALVIVSFLCGVHWGIALLHSHNISLNLFLLSNLLVVVLWLSFLLLNPLLTGLLIIIELILLLFIDYRLFTLGFLSRWYMNLRLQVTLLVNLCIVLLLVRL